MDARTRSLLAVALAAVAAVALWVLLARGPSTPPRSEYVETATEARAPSAPERPSAAEAPAASARAPALAPSASLYEERIHGRLVMKGTGVPPPGQARVSVSTGQPEIDQAAALARLGGGKEASERLRKMPEREALAFWASLGGRSSFLAAEAAPDGSFEIAAPRDLPPFRLGVEADFAHLPETGRPFTLDEARAGISLELEPGGNVEVAVLDPSGAPVPQARLSLVREMPIGRSGTAAQAGPDGRFVKRGAPPGRYRAAAAAEGWSPSAWASFEFRAGETAKVDLALAPESFVSGRVVDEERKGIAGARVTVRREKEDDPFLSNILGAPRTEADGSFRAGSLVPGAWLVTASEEGWLPGGEVRVEVPAGRGVEGLRLVLRSGNFVAGRVLNAEHRPVAGIEVTIDGDFEAYEAKFRRRPERFTYRRVETDANGAFRATGLKEAPFRVAAVQRGGGTAEARGVEAGKADLLLVLSPPTGFAGRVVDAETGAPVPHFGVGTMRWEEGNPLLKQGGPTLPFDSTKGEFEILGVRPGVHDLTFRAGGFVATTLEKVEVAAGEVHRGLEARLVKPATARGRVVEAATGAPVSGAVVTISERDPTHLRFSASVEAFQGSGWTREDGTFEVEGIVPGTVALRAHREGFVEGKTEPFEARPGALVEGISIALSRGGGIDGYAIGRDGKPWTGSRVLASSAEGSGGWTGFAGIDESGYFRIEALAPGEYRVEVHPQTRDTPVAFALALRARAVVEEGKVARVDFSPLPGTCTVRGHVFRGSEPFPKAEVWTVPEGFSGDGTRLPHGLTNESGAFELVGVPPGPNRFHVRPVRDYWAWRTEIRVEVPEQGEFTVDLVLPTGEILGRVVRSSDGSAVPRAEVGVVPLEGRSVGRIARATTEDDGSFRFRDLEPGEYELGARTGDGSLGPSGPVRVEVTGDAPAHADISMPESGSIAVSVLGPDGRALPQALVSFQDVGSSGAYGGLTDVRGRARKTGLAAGRYLVWAVHGDLAPGHSEEVAVEPGREAACTIRLERGVEVRIRATGETGPVPLQHHSVRLVGDREIPSFVFVRPAPPAPAKDDPGTVYRTLAPGEFRLIVECPGYRKHEQALVVGPDSTQEVAVVLAREEPPR